MVNELFLIQNYHRPTQNKNSVGVFVFEADSISTDQPLFWEQHILTNIMFELQQIT